MVNTLHSLLFIAVMSSTACATQLSGVSDCSKVKGLKLNSLIVQKIQKVKGESIVESEVPLEKHYYPQMDRPKKILVSSPKEVVLLSLLGKDRTTKDIKVSEKKKDQYQFILPSFAKFDGKLLLQFKDNERCQSSLVFEELSP